jgi:hypothetical protein
MSYWSGQTCFETGTYGQYNDATEQYAGRQYDRYVLRGHPFPPTEDNHHFKKK